MKESEKYMYNWAVEVDDFIFNREKSVFLLDKSSLVFEIDVSNETYLPIFQTMFL